MRAPLLALMAACLWPALALANHHGGGSDPFGGGSSSSSTSSGPDYDADCIRWELADDGGLPDGSVEVAPADVPTDGGVQGLVCVEHASYTTARGCGCDVVTGTALGLLGLVGRLVVRRRR